MTPHYCPGNAKMHGKDRKGNQRFRCRVCGKTFIEEQDENPLGDMRLPKEKALMVLRLLTEGCSVRSAERITGVHRDTVLRLLVYVGNRCEKLLENMIQGVKVRDVECDELWNFIGMKEKTKKKLKINDPALGDAYTFVAIERTSKLILAWHLGRRTHAHTEQFLNKVDMATEGGFQLSTDGWSGYQDLAVHCLGTKASFGQVVKHYSANAADQARYSPPEVVKVEKIARFGKPDMDRMTTGHVERQNLTIRTFCKRFARLTLSFSRKWENLKAALALFFAHYNLCRIHGSLRVTPGMEAGVTNHVWSLEDLLEATTQC